MIDDELAILLMIYIHLKMIDDDAHVLNPFIDDLVWYLQMIDDDLDRLFMMIYLAQKYGYVFCKKLNR